MKIPSLLSLLLLLIAGAAPERAQAQSNFGIGGHVGYDVEFSRPFVGVQARIGTPAFPLLLQPGAEITLGEEQTTWLEANLLYMVGESYTNTFTPYFGAGLSYETGDTDTDASTLGANLIGGIQFGFGPGLAPFVQVRYTVDLEGAEPGEEQTSDPIGVMAGAIFRF